MISPRLTVSGEEPCFKKKQGGRKLNFAKDGRLLKCIIGLGWRRGIYKTRVRGLTRDRIRSVTQLQSHSMYIKGKLGGKIRVSWVTESRYLEYKFYAFPNIVCSRLRFFESFETAFSTRLLGPFDRYLA